MEFISNSLFSNAALKAYWRLSNTTDSGPNGYTLTNINTVAFSAGKYGNCADFSATNTNKNLHIDSSLGIGNGACTISLWVKNRAEVGSGSYRYIEKSQGASHVSYIIGYEYNSGSPRFSFGRARLGVATEYIYYPITAGTANWYHLAVTYDNANVKGYFNGAYVDSVAASGDGTSGGIDVTTIACNRDQDANFSSAYIDDIAIFGASLSAAQIKSIYRNMGGSFLLNFV